MKASVFFKNYVRVLVSFNRSTRDASVQQGHFVGTSVKFSIYTGLNNRCQKAEFNIWEGKKTAKTECFCLNTCDNKSNDFNFYPMMGFGLLPLS